MVVNVDLASAGLASLALGANLLAVAQEKLGTRNQPGGPIQEFAKGLAVNRSRHQIGGEAYAKGMK
jgi:hypothetical protein